MEPSGCSTVRFDEPKSKRRLALSFVGYAGVLCLTALIASGAPDVYYKLTGTLSDRNVQHTERTYFSKTPVELSPANQAVFFGEELKNPGYPESDLTLTYESGHIVSLWGSDEDVKCPSSEKCTLLVDQDELSTQATCRSGKEMCDRVELLTVNSIKYKYYHTQIKILDSPTLDVFTGPFIYQHDVLYVNSDYTLKWELPWTYFNLFATLLLLLLPRVGLYPRLKSIRRMNCQWSWQQKWALGLTSLLLLYNDPLLALQVSVPGASAGLEVFHVVIAAFFIAAAMLFWLILFGAAARGGSSSSLGDSPVDKRSSSLWETVRRWAMLESALVAVIYISFVATYSEARTGKEYNSNFDSNNLPSAGGLRAVGFVGLTVYMVWLAVQIFRGVRRFLGLSRNFKAVYLLSVFSVVMTIVGLFAGITRPLQEDAVLYWVWNMHVNLYIWVLGWGYAPSARALLGEGSDSVSMTRSEGAYKRDATDTFGVQIDDEDNNMSSVIKSPRREADADLSMRLSPRTAAGAQL
jgi:hypothetical protein